MRHTAIAAAILLLALPAGAADGEEQDVVLYTNADVEKLEPLPTGGLASNPEFDATLWAFVNEFVERERARINDDRDHELARERVEIEARRPVGYGERYPYLLRVPYFEPFGSRPRTTTVPEADADAGPTAHPMFHADPPVREFVPGLGDSYRGRGKS